jgi:hypothetical protein
MRPICPIASTPSSSPAPGWSISASPTTSSAGFVRRIAGLETALHHIHDSLDRIMRPETEKPLGELS